MIKRENDQERERQREREIERERDQKRSKERMIKRVVVILSKKGEIEIFVQQFYSQVKIYEISQACTHTYTVEHIDDNKKKQQNDNNFELEFI